VLRVVLKQQLLLTVAQLLNFCQYLLELLLLLKHPLLLLLLLARLVAWQV
jgi:hypothetical protein